MRLVDWVLRDPTALAADELRRGRLVVGTALASATLSFVTAIHAISIGQTVAACALASCCAAMSSSAVLLRRGVALGLVAKLVVAELLAFLSYLAIGYGGTSSATAYWLVILPLVTVALAGARAAAFSAIVVVTEFIGWYAASSFGARPLYQSPPHVHAWWALVCSVQATIFLAVFGILSEREHANSRTELLAARERVEAEMVRRQKMEAVLRLRSRAEAASQLTNGLAHEINSPLQIVGDNVSFMQESVGALMQLAETARSASERTEGGLQDVAAGIAAADLPFLARELPTAALRVEQGLARIATIVRVMRSLTETDNSPYARVNFAQLLHEAVATVREAHPGRVEFVTNLSPMPTVLCRAAEMSEVVLALLRNAAQAIEQGGEAGTVTVGSSCDEGWVTLTVSDDGCGIAPDVRDRVYDPFFTTRPVGGGLGQGLTVARVIVERHRGTIDFDSQVGVGTTFTVRVPLDAEGRSEV